MNILQVVPYLYPALSYGGPAKVVYDLSLELSKVHNVTIYTTDVWDDERRIGKNEKLVINNKLKIHYFRNLLNMIAFKFRIFTSFGAVYAYLREKDNFDIVHINDVFVLSNLLIAYIAIFNKKTYFYSPHGVLAPIRTNRKRLLKGVIFKLLAKKALKKSGRIIATSDSEKKDLKNLGLDNVTAVFNGIPITKFRPSNKYHRFKKEGVFTLLYIGKLHPLKGLKELIEVLSSLAFPCRLLIAGPDDGQKKELQKLISRNGLKNVYFLGFVDDMEKAELFSLSDVFVHPSLSEGFSISILEAMNYGLPVLISDACNFPDVEKYEAGIIVPVKELKSSLTKALRYLNSNMNILKQRGKNAKILVRGYYSIKAMAQNLVKVYEIYN